MIEKIDLNLMKFDRPEDEEQAILDLRGGLNSPFWLFIQRVIDRNIEKLDEELHETEGLSTMENDSLKFRIKFLKKLKALPADQLAALAPSQGDEADEEEDEDDPYHTKPPKRPTRTKRS